MLSSFTEELAKRNWLLADGAIGTNLFEMGLSNGDAPEIWNETEPQKIKKLHRMFGDAGSELFLTNSFGANRARLKLHKLEKILQTFKNFCGTSERSCERIQK